MIRTGEHSSWQTACGGEAGTQRMVDRGGSEEGRERRGSPFGGGGGGGANNIKKVFTNPCRCQKIYNKIIYPVPPKIKKKKQSK